MISFCYSLFWGKRKIVQSKQLVILSVQNPMHRVYTADK